MMSTIRFSILFLLFTEAIHAQDSAATDPYPSFHAIGVTIGVNQIKEENLLPRVHSGFITTLSYQYLRMSETYQDLRFALGYSRVIATPEDITKSVNALVTLSYSYAFKLAEAPSFVWFLGPLAKAAYSVSLYPNWDDSHLYWGDVFSLGITNALLYTFGGDSRLFSTISLPILSLYSRPETLRLYKFDETSFEGIVRNLHQDPTGGFVNKAFALHFDLEYQFPVFRTKTQGVFFSMDYGHVTADNALPLTQLIYQVGLRILL
jgi:hypothetical protein